ncbi:GrpE-domain-containing protein [Mycena pura]|uniref:GrpE protein homolog, mitochondrial n=1 Tax=Mycena pura TaxID=153505 RepID=A0AAD6YGS0_9AGAR|nr:GrpE-domain-containing protein [Mycena pura]
MSSVLAVPFRQWTTSLSFRPACRIRPALIVRHYSEDKAPSSADPAPTDQDAPKDVPSSEPTPDSALEKAQAEAADLLGRLRYLQADFLNLQRNSAREREKTRDFAISNFASDLLETVDVLSLALKSVPQPVLTPPTSASTSADAPPPLSDSDAPVPEPPSNSPPTKTAEEYLRELYTGVEMTQRQLLQTLFKYHVKPFDPTGDTFDPNRHEALYQAPIPGKTPGTVIHCQKTGFTIRDRVLRAAQVGVAQESQS